MNPLRWFRWKLAVVLAVAIVALQVLGIDPLAYKKLNEIGESGESGARWQIEGIDFSLVGGRVTVEGIRAAGAAKDPEKGRVLTAEAMEVDLDMTQALRRRFYMDAFVQAPDLKLERRADGTIEVGSDEPPSESPPRDWNQAAIDWFGRLKNWKEKYDRHRDKLKGGWTKGDEKVEGERKGVDYSAKITYPFEDVPKIVARTLAAEGFEIKFVDSSKGSSGETIQPLSDGALKITNVSDKPSRSADPIRFELSGNLAGAKLLVQGTLDLRDPGGETAQHRLSIKAQAVGLPLALANLFAGESLPLHFEAGSLDLLADLDLINWDGLHLAPQLAFKDAKASPRQGVNRIAGFDAEQFCKAFNEVGSFEITDLKIEGSLTRPEFHLGTTIQDLVTSGGKAFAKKKLDEGVQNALVDLKEQLDKKGVELPDGLDSESAAKKLKGLFGGDKKKKDGR